MTEHDWEFDPRYPVMDMLPPVEAVVCRKCGAGGSRFQGEDNVTLRKGESLECEGKRDDARHGDD